MLYAVYANYGVIVRVKASKCKERGKKRQLQQQVFSTSTKKMKFRSSFSISFACFFSLFLTPEICMLCCVCTLNFIK